MKLKKSSIAMILAVIMTLTMAVGGTLAYLTDADNAVNEFTMGNVAIELQETYKQNETLWPNVSVEKKVSVKNVGKNDAYVFMTVAVPATAPATDTDSVEPIVKADFNKTNWTVKLAGQEEYQKITIDSENYALYVFQYNTKLEPEQETSKLMEKITLDPRVDYNPETKKYELISNGKSVAEIKNKLTAGKVYVNAYAIQTEGVGGSVDSAYTAFAGQWLTDGAWTQNQIKLPDLDGTTPAINAQDTASLNAALSAAQPQVPITIGLSSDTTYDLSKTNAAGKVITFSGTKDTVIDATKINHNEQRFNGAALTFDGITINWADANEGYQGLVNAEKVVYKNCTIIGTQFMYGDADFINCTFVTPSNYDGYCVYGRGEGTLTFTDCTFTTGGRAIMLFQDQTTNVTVKLNGCTFSDNGTYTSKPKAVVETGDGQYKTSVFNIEINNCTITGDGFEENNSTSKLWGNKDSIPAERLSVKIDGVKVY